MSNLEKLSENLFQLFDDIKNDNIDIDKAKALNTTAGTIIKNVKTQLHAVQTFSKTGSVPNGVLSKQSVKNITTGGTLNHSAKDLRKQQDSYAKQLGYKDYLHALRNMTAKQFELSFNENYNYESN